MDTDALHSALISVALIGNKLHATRQHFTEDVASASLNEVLTHAEMDLKVAKAIIASELGFDLCKQCWPPEVLVPHVGKVTRCPQCETFSIGAEHKNYPMIAKMQLAIWHESVALLSSVASIK